MDCKRTLKNYSLWSIASPTKKLLNPLPENKSDEEIANDFADFFIEKIQKSEISLPM